MTFNKLSQEEEKIIVHKDTEAPFSGEYDQIFDDGIYLCRRCNTPLYRSEDKFDAHCGWPSFDQEILGAVKHQLDADGHRTEILCNTCDAHLGHVFVGEKMTEKDTRHCVNSLSMKFVKNSEVPKSEIAVFGAGCFWSVEAIYKKIKGVISVTPGYAGGEKKDPTYEQVVGGATGHAETVKIEFDPTEISYAGLLELFFELHDPTTLNKQGNDVGTNYRSLILYNSDNQKFAAEKKIKELTDEHKFNSPIVTEVNPLTDFYPAESYHFDYYEKNQEQPYCQVIIGPKLKKFEEKFKSWMK